MLRLTKMYNSQLGVRGTCPHLCTADLQVCGQIRAHKLWIDGDAVVRKSLMVGKRACFPRRASFAGIDYVWPDTKPIRKQVLTASNEAGELIWSDASNSETAAGPTNSVQRNQSGKLFGADDFTFDGSQCRIKGEVESDSIVSQSLDVTTTAKLPGSTSLASVSYAWPKELPKTDEVLTATDDEGRLEWQKGSSVNPATGPEGSVQRNLAGGLHGSSEFTYDTNEACCSIVGKISADSLQVNTSTVGIANVVYEWPDTEPSTGTVLTSSQTGKLEWAAPAQTPEPGGPPNSVQINAAGEFGGSSALVFSDGVLGLDGDVTCSGGLNVATVDVTTTVNTANIAVSETLTANNVDATAITATGAIEGYDVTATQKLVCGGSTITSDEVSCVNVTAGERIEGKNLKSSGPIEAVGLLSGGSIACDGNMTCGGDMTVTGSMTAANLSCDGDVHGASVTSTGQLAGTNLQLDGAKTTINQIEYTWPSQGAVDNSNTLMSSIDGSLQWAEVKPPGDNQEVIYNDNGSFGADPAFQFDPLQKGATLGGSPVTIGATYYKLLTDNVSNYQRVTDSKFILLYTYSIDDSYTAVATIPQLVFPAQESYPPVYSARFVSYTVGAKLQLNWYVYFPDGQPSNMPESLQFFAFLTMPTY